MFEMHASFTIIVVSFLVFQVSCVTSNSRLKREAYKLPAGAKEVVGKDIKTNFKCENDGFYADIDNDCKLFHRCHTANNAGGNTEVMHHTFMCGKNTVFDQSTFACKHDDDAIPCDASPMFFDLNERLGKDGPFLTEADIERAKNARPEYRARARARRAKIKAKKAQSRTRRSRNSTRKSRSQARKARTQNRKSRT